MKRLLFFILFFVVASGFIPMTSYGAGEERFTFSDLTATDKSTGLVWTRDANIAGREMAWDNALRFIKQLNGKKYGGFSDWRLPTKDELLTLVDYAKKQGYKKDFRKLLNKAGFTNVQADFYWSSSTHVWSLPTHASDTTSPSVVGMYSGFVAPGFKTFTYNVWPVRGGK